MWELRIYEEEVGAWVSVSRHLTQGSAEAESDYWELHGYMTDVAVYNSGLTC